MEDKKCCHKLNSKKCTIKILNRRFMVNPEIIEGVCTCCGKTFQYKSEDIRKMSKKEEERNEDF